jgi:hypothetical protein
MHLPDRFVENLDFDEPAIAGGIDRFAQRAQFDHPIAHHTAPVEHIGQRRDPVGHMITGDPRATLLDELVHPGIPPDVVCIDHNLDVKESRSVPPGRSLRADW